MTKQQELQSLADYRDSLPEGSYLKPWLTHIFAEVQDRILSDYPVTTTSMAKMQEDIDERCLAAERYCDAAIKRGDAHLRDAIIKASEEAARIKAEARHACSLAMHALEA